MSKDGLDALRARVHGDADLARRLRHVAPEAFGDEVLRLAADAGCEVTAADLHEAGTQARQTWLLRWIR